MADEPELPAAALNIQSRTSYSPRVNDGSKKNSVGSNPPTRWT
jgi:hypothetical protein